MESYKDWKYKNTTFLLASIIIFFYFVDFPFVKDLVMSMGNFGYFGAFVAGILFVSTFTVAPAAIALFYLGGELNIGWLALAAGLGAVLGDLLLFQFIRDKVFGELRPLFEKVTSGYLSKLFKTQYFNIGTIALGAIIIASPFPDEVGLSLMGLSKIKIWQFLLLSFVLNTAGILIVLTIAHGIN